jgi:hypothetical protein
MDLINFYDNQVLTANNDTDWKNRAGVAENNSGKVAQKSTLLLEWKSGAGTADGTIKVYGSVKGSTDYQVLIDTIIIDSFDNSAACEKLDIDSAFTALKLVYTENNLTSITLNADWLILE